MRSDTTQRIDSRHEPTDVETSRTAETSEDESGPERDREDAEEAGATSIEGTLHVLSELCQWFLERGESPWVPLDPPTEDQMAENESKRREIRNKTGGCVQDYGGYLGNWYGAPIKAGFRTDAGSDEVEMADDVDVRDYQKYRVSKYDVHFRIAEYTPQMGEEGSGETELVKAGTTGLSGELDVDVPTQDPVEGTLRLVATKETPDGRLKGRYTSAVRGNDGVGKELDIEVDGKIEAGNTVTVRVANDDGPAIGADIAIERPVRLPLGEVYVECRDRES